MVVVWELNGQRFTGINGGPEFKFTEAVSLETPEGMEELFSDPDPQRADRAMQAMLKMQKLDIAALRAAADGQPVSG